MYEYQLAAIEERQHDTGAGPARSTELYKGNAHSRSGGRPVLRSAIHHRTGTAHAFPAGPLAAKEKVDANAGYRGHKPASAADDPPCSPGSRAPARGLWSEGQAL